MTDLVGDRLTSAGLRLPRIAPAKGVYSMGILSGTQIFLAGHGPVDAEGQLITGTIGLNLSQESGRDAARHAALALMYTCRQIVRNLDRIGGFLTLRVSIASALVLDPVDIANAASGVLVVAWPKAPPPTRTVVMCEALPLGVPLVLEAIATL